MKGYMISIEAIQRVLKNRQKTGIKLTSNELK